MAKKQKILNKIEKIREHQEEIDALLDDIEQLLEGNDEPETQEDGGTGGEGPGNPGGGG